MRRFRKRLTITGLLFLVMILGCRSENVPLSQILFDKDVYCGDSVAFTYAGSQETYGTVVSANGRCWLDRNLGASRVAQSPFDALAYGDLFQWGRADDGHQKRNSSTTFTLNSSDKPGHDSFILSNPDHNFDWRTPPNENLWQGVNGINNPCPHGYRLPAEEEWITESQSWNGTNATAAFTSPLKLSLAGYRGGSSGSLVSVTSNGLYWSSSTSDTRSLRLNIGSSNFHMSEDARAGGGTIRCIKD